MASIPSIEAAFTVALAAAFAVVAARVGSAFRSWLRDGASRRTLALNDLAWSLIPLVLLAALSLLVLDVHA